ncbi:aromatic ring-hydroxylating dioxygenase subunit alpha [Novosphingobium cyanobacteriorum]|uniref:Aromatic ring-hydroxylating dioxygenase subunit alpha n=1 Tax=Novosphingobium cyanobacteriorum TaxID=3024215 RepID=A0ABT6CJK3_9SPHN|nr:aromatic ring-hydroxylating dioxygenase subunit alpha [Novosphingobium cyanobacteriorum]MDF8332522.1 aromatic ring-hydroxylating dioxygenase subunit alpha [Novosphingobium cyanobacteriorum]
MSEFVRNTWYMAAWANEVPEDGFLARTFLDEPWLILRKSDGSWAMMADRCPHRFVPLSRGKRKGDTVACGYHGLTFDTDGACVFNPFGREVPPETKVAARPIVEKDGALWFWPGAPDRADPALIPDFSFIDDASDARDHLVMDVNYELISDNLLDLSHAEFLHVETFGVNGSLFECGKQTVETDASGGLWNKWDMVGSRAPVWAEPIVGPGVPVDQWLHIRWHAPASLALYIGMARTGTDRNDLVVPPMANPHILTPKTATETHYFFTRGHGEEAAAMARRVFLEEDEPMIRAQQEAMKGRDFWEMRPVIMPSDAAAIRARRKLMQMRRDEAIEGADAV